MHVLVIEYSGRVVPESTASYIGESAIEKNLCDAFDKLNIATLNELLSGMKQLYSEFQVIHKQLTQCKRPQLGVCIYNGRFVRNCFRDERPISSDF